jgi:hypothetical protein
MCAYCMCGDWQFKYNPPWPQPSTPTPLQPWHPLIPAPANPVQPVIPWSLEQLKEYRDLLLQIKELEDKLGCPCEPNKADYLELFKQRIEALEKKVSP